MKSSSVVGYLCEIGCVFILFNVSKYIISDISFGMKSYVLFLSLFGFQLLITYHVVCSSGLQALLAPVFSKDLDNTVLRAKHELGSSKESWRREDFTKIYLSSLICF